MKPIRSLLFQLTFVSGIALGGCDDAGSTDAGTTQLPDAFVVDATLDLPSPDAQTADAQPADAQAADAQPADDQTADAQATDPQSDAGPLRDGLLVHESFSGAGLLTGRTTGVGFSGAWMGAGRVEADGLTYARGGRALVTAGGALDVNGGSSSRILDITRLAPSLAEVPGKIGRAGESAWISFLAAAPAGIQNGQFAGLQLFDGDNEVRFVGAPFYQSSDPARAPHWGVDQGGLATPVYTGVSVRDAALLVLRIDFGVTGGDAGVAETRISLWVNPGLGDGAPLGVASLVLSGADFRFNRIQANGFPGFLVDEIRVGGSFADVTPSTVAESAIASESFVYSDGSPVFGNARGFGFVSPWSSPNSISSSGMLEGAGLSYTSGTRTLVASGGRLTVASGPPAQRSLDARGLGASVGDGTALGGPGTTVWLSLLATTVGLDDGKFGGIQLLETRSGMGPAEHLFVGAPYFEANNSMRAQAWGIDAPLRALPAYSSTLFSNPEAVLLVVRITQTAAEARISLWTNPSLLGDESALGAFAAEITRSPFRFDLLRVNANYTGFFVDELRVGASLAAVVPSR